ncbi:CHAT domain-containing protein [Streptomyces sp. NPDC046727]|uniref:CHAT domain-containing protein n=1 Tax=Streptomyces sp. NPDC046727 TaxID=3155373 RepID=UPI00340FCCB7
MMRGRGGRTAGEPMVSEAQRDDGGTGPAERQAEADGAVREALRLYHVSEGWPPVEALDPVIDRLVRAEAALAQHKEDFTGVFIVLGLMVGTRYLSRGDATSYGSGAEDRAEALRRLRWADRNGPLTDLFIAQARMMLVFVLVPWALPRRDGTRTVLTDALLAATDDEVLTDALRRDLTEADEIVDRLAAAPLDAEFQKQTAKNKQIVERMLGTRFPVTMSETAAPATAPAATDTATPRPGQEVEDADGPGSVDDADDDPETVLLDAVRGLVALAGARSTAAFTRILIWLFILALSGPGERPGSYPYEELQLDPQAGALLSRVAASEKAGVDGVRRAADLALGALRALPPDAPQRARVARLHAYLLVMIEHLEPGSVDFRSAERPSVLEGESGDRLGDWPAGLSLEPGLAAYLDDATRDFSADLGVRERRYAALLDRLLAYRTGDPGYLDDAATLLREALDASPPGSWWVMALRGELAEILELAASYGGSFHDADLSLATVRELGATLRDDGSLPPDAPFILDILLSTADRELDHAQRTGNHEALPRLVEELRARHAALPPDTGWRGKVAKRLDRIDGLTAKGRQQGTGPGDSSPDLAAERADLERSIAEMRRTFGGRELYHHQEYDRHAWAGLRLYLSFRRGLEDPAVLDEAITELTRARALIAEGRGGTHRVDVLTKLAETHIIRAARRGPDAEADRQAFVEITREALDELTADVLLQVGADHGLSAALNGALLARRLAFVAFLMRRPADVVADLEKGRALVHQAAAASRSIPELLEAAGRPELARRWRAQVPGDPLRPETGDASAPPADGPPIPSALRRGALAALGVRPGAGPGAGPRQLAGTTDLAALTAGLAASGADALVYLMPGVTLPAATHPGYAVILRPGAGPTLLPLPRLLASDDSPLERYLRAAAERSRALADPDMSTSWRAAYEAEWQAALDALCDWAWPAVMGPVLSVVRPLLAALWPRARPPRIVLVPCERLGVVPWHAARIRGIGAHGHRYACQEAVISYAPSGTQFLAAAGRRRMAPGAGRQVLVADPELTLPWAEVETVALRAACYPSALRYGEFLTIDGEPDAAGTPDELLAVLPGGASQASVVHLACHGWAAPRPTDSALRLAGVPGADPDTGRLTVAGLLDGAAGSRPDTAGPLVVLSACETDLSTGHHDEALTLTTALVTRGAADVVGSRWAVRDGPTAVMMAVFHHCLTARGLAPPDALRAAQLWMLNPRRTLSFPLEGPLRREAARPDLHRLPHWAAFTHQGNPSDTARTTSRTSREQ